MFSILLVKCWCRLPGPRAFMYLSKIMLLILVDRILILVIPLSHLSCYLHYNQLLQSTIL